jgi:hypothetical protein
LADRLPDKAPLGFTALKLEVQMKLATRLLLISLVMTMGYSRIVKADWEEAAGCSISYWRSGNYLEACQQETQSGGCYAKWNNNTSVPACTNHNTGASPNDPPPNCFYSILAHKTWSGTFDCFGGGGDPGGN